MKMFHPIKKQKILLKGLCHKYLADQNFGQNYIKIQSSSSSIMNKIFFESKMNS